MSEQTPETPETPAPPAPEPTPTVSEADASFSRPPGSAAPSGGAAAAPSESPLDRPEVQVGLAFAGGLVLATILKRLGR